MAQLLIHEFGHLSGENIHISLHSHLAENELICQVRIFTCLYILTWPKMHRNKHFFGTKDMRGNSGLIMGSRTCATGVLSA